MYVMQSGSLTGPKLKKGFVDCGQDTNGTIPSYELPGTTPTTFDVRKMLSLSNSKISDDEVEQFQTIVFEHTAVLSANLWMSSTS